MRKILLFNLFLILSYFAYGQEKTALHPDVYEDWKEISKPEISSDGKYIAYEINPQKGDGVLIIRNVKKGDTDTIQRAYKASFSYDSRFLVGMIKPQEDSVRSGKKQKLKAHQMPKDTLFIYNLKSQVIEKVPGVRTYSLSEEERNLIVYHHEYMPGEEESEGDEENTEDSEIDKAFSKIQKKYKLADLVVYDPQNENSQRFENVASFSLSENGHLVGFHQFSRDTVLFSVIYALTTPDNVLEICHEEQGIADRLTCDKSGKKMAFLFARDSTAITGHDLHYWEIGKDNSEVLIDSTNNPLPKGFHLNKHGKIYFSGNSERLFFGSSAYKEKEKEDTLLKEERVSLDVWNWKDQLLQPMQKKQKESELKRTYLAYYDLPSSRVIQLADSLVRNVRTMHEGNGNAMIGFAGLHYGKLLSWEGYRYSDVYYVNPENGEKDLLVEKISASVMLSPFGKYLAYYSRPDSSWFTIDLKTGEKKNITEDLNVYFHDEDNDIPMLPRSYGSPGFTENDRYILLYDQYDIWKIDPSGKESPENLTKGEGRENKIRFRYIKLDEDDYFVDLDETLYLSAFHTENMKGGYYFLQKGDLTQLHFSPHDYSGLKKAKDEDIFVFSKGDFQEYNNLYLAYDQKMKDPTKISDANPQQNNFLWGDVRLVNWLSFNGDRLKGLLYTPENLDETKKYPLLVYFYEKSSHNLNRHRIPSPSRSIINPAYCTSNGYVVFVPDIIYRDGYPGQSAYDAVISGTQAMLERYDFIDSEKMGLQGQSWGGYQIAWLVTQTNLFEAAMAGAPVSNMTSAYGGIRWGSGMSRMFQYENTQSRIGGTLWDKQALYIENSPLFHAPRIETPLLIMHNDDDGAVPWYQGIELFVALRRLGKPVWMLTYNNEAHNLRRWPNRMDLDIRMMQFFDYYLKGEPMPEWMEVGVPAIRKNEVTGRELLKE